MIGSDKGRNCYPHTTLSKQGWPVYHYRTPPLGCVKVLKEKFGIELDNRVWNFTKEEDRKIHENWATFAKKHKLKKNHILDFVGYENDGTFSKKTPKNQPRLFWPFICNGLPTRSARTVLHRICYIFDEFYNENDEYDFLELDKLRKTGKSVQEISETLRIPIFYVSSPRSFPIPKIRVYKPKKPQHSSPTISADEQPKRKISIFTKSDCFLILKCLYESVTDEFGGYNLKSFDWDEFRIRCQEASIDEPPKCTLALNKYKSQYFTAQTNIFVHLEPEPSLTNKLTFIYEALVRYTCQNLKRRDEHRLQMRLPTLFTVIYEAYTSENSDWELPAKLEKYQEMVDVLKVENRVEMVKEQRKRARDSESPRFAIRTKKLKVEERNERRGLRAVRFEENDTLEISSIHGETSSIVSTHAEEDITHLDVTTDASTSLRLDETILARGGGTTSHPEEVQSIRVEETKSAFDSLLLPKIDEEAKKMAEKREKKPFELNDSLDLWSQLVSNS
uniref:Uncharacterized protein n=1 Tax=Caenorhabditis japonica TaxID=281687 RepID=A0A8R1HJN4_CAEJA